MKEIFFLPNYNDFIAKKILELINPMDKTIIFVQIKLMQMK
ncbi:hypothetical protein ACNGKW_06845 [Campylobacter jejuni]